MGLICIGFIVTDDAKWVVVQQGMNGDHRQARRYHWFSEGVGDFVNEPHAAIEGASGDKIINLTDRRAATSRDAQLDLLKSLGPDGITKEAGILIGVSKKVSRQLNLPHLIMPAHHDETIRTLKSAVQNARLGQQEELAALKRLDQQARQLEVWAKAPSFEAVLAEERQESPAYGGRSAFGWERDAGPRQRSKAS